MKKTSSLIAALSATGALIAVGAVSAQSSSSGSSGTPTGTTNNAGMQIANSGAPNSVAACASCHGAHGEGNAGAGFPRIAGQSQYYLSRQMASFANGSRNNPVMSPIAKAMTQQQINDVSAYYAALSTPSSKPAQTATAKVIDRGRVLSSIGDNSKGVQACANCHGPGGSGEGPDFPYLAGQHNNYLVTALGEWKSGARNTDPSLQMSIISKHLSNDDIAAVAAYYSTQPAPVPEASRANIPSGSVMRPVRPGAPGAMGQQPAPTQGVGTEQGAPTTGGAPGPGGGGGASGSGPQGSSTGGTP
jgi:cytochrome c553